MEFNAWNPLRVAKYYLYPSVQRRQQQLLLLL
jgi:hypothetical protein